MTGKPGPLTRLGLTAVLAASLGATVIVAPASPSLVAATSTSAVLSLPAGPVPVGVPYGIGKVLNLNGIGYNMSPSCTSMLGRPPLGFDGVEFQDIDITRGVPVWAIRLTAVDPASRVGWFRPRYAPRLPEGRRLDADNPPSPDLLQTLPMLSDDGTKAVVVRGNHVRLYDTRTGAQINATNAPTLPAADATHSYALIMWQGASSYLVNVRDGNTLAILRCNALSRFCTRAVTSSVRTGVTRILS